MRARHYGVAGSYGRLVLFVWDVGAQRKATQGAREIALFPFGETRGFSARPES